MMSRGGARAALGAVSAACLLSACSEEETLEGERQGLRDGRGTIAAPVEIGPGGEVRGAEAAAPEDTSFAAPPPVAPESWPQTRGGPAHHIPHLAFDGALDPVWRVDIGAGNDRRHRIAAAPVVAGGRIAAMDARSHVSAVSPGGELLWQTDLTPPGERNADASGGGVAAGGGRLYASTGFGTVAALDPETGAVLWVQETGAGVTAAPAYRDGIVYAVARDDTAWAIRADDGRVLWQLSGTPAPAGFLGGASPAVTDRQALLPFASNEVVGALAKGGVRLWSSGVAGRREGRVYARYDDISGDPVVAGGTVFFGTQSGRTVALDAADGTRRWTADEGAYSPVWVAGNSVFLISDAGALVRLDRGSGAVIWRRDLPHFTRETPGKRSDVETNFGPVLAGGRLIVASGDGRFRLFDPGDGSPLGTRPIGGGAAADPIVAGGTLYLVTSGGRLAAFR